MEHSSTSPGRIHFQFVKLVLFVAAVIVILSMVIGLVKYVTSPQSAQPSSIQQIQPSAVHTDSPNNPPPLVKQDAARLEDKPSGPADSKNSKERTGSKELAPAAVPLRQGQARPVTPEKKFPGKKHVLAKQRLSSAKAQGAPPTPSQEISGELKDKGGACSPERLCRDKKGVQIYIPTDWARDAQCNCVPLRTAAQDIQWKHDCSGMDWLRCKNRCTQSNMNRRDCDALYGPGRFE